MARRNRENAENTSTTEDASTEAPATLSEEDASMTATTEAPAETTPEVPAEDTATEAPAAAEQPIDLTAFTATVDEAVAGRDETTGEVPEALLTSAQTEYRNLDGLKAKNAAKKLVEERMREAMNQRDISSARAFMLVSDNLTAGASASKEKAPADPKEAFLQRYTSLVLAAQLVAEEAPEGVDPASVNVEDLLESAKALRAYEANEAEDKGDAPEASPVVKAAVKLATGKSARVGGGSRAGSTFTGERRDIGKHIAEAFASVEAGQFLTVAEIRKFKSEEYGDNPPSAGAISARLFPTSGKCTVEGVEPGQNDKGNKGATKIA